MDTQRLYLARTLRELRNASGMTAEEVGIAVGKSGKTVSAWEVGRGQPDADKLIELCRLFNVGIERFYTPDSSGGFSLTTEEYRLVSLWRGAIPEARRYATIILSDGQKSRADSISKAA